MKPSPMHPAAKALLFSWAAVYLPYTLLLVWVGTGEDALAGPSTTADNIFAGVWLVLSALQLYVVIRLNKHYKPWLFWVAMVLVTLSVGSVAIGPIIALLGA